MVHASFSGNKGMGEFTTKMPETTQKIELSAAPEMSNKYRVDYNGKNHRRGPFREGGSFDARAQSPGEGSRDRSNNSYNSIM